MKVCLDCGRPFDALDWRCPACGREPVWENGYLSFAPDLARSYDGYNSAYFAQLAQLEAANFWFRSRNQLIKWALRHYFPRARNFLEIGCGTGYVLTGLRQVLPGLALSGSEILSAGLAFAEPRLPGVTLFQMDARRIPFEEEFDVIGAFDVLEHIEDDEAVLKQTFRACRPGGAFS